MREEQLELKCGLMEWKVPAKQDSTAIPEGPAWGLPSGVRALALPPVLKPPGAARKLQRECFRPVHRPRKPAAEFDLVATDEELDILFRSDKYIREN
jgi:hypothetical protein